MAFPEGICFSRTKGSSAVLALVGLRCCPSPNALCLHAGISALVCLQGGLLGHGGGHFPGGLLAQALLLCCSSGPRTSAPAGGLAFPGGQTRAVSECRSLAVSRLLTWLQDSTFPTSTLPDSRSTGRQSYTFTVLRGIFLENSGLGADFTQLC